MNATRQVSWNAPFDTDTCGNGWWRLRQREPNAATVYLRGFALPAGLEACTALGLAWPAAGAPVVTVTLPSGTVSIPVTAAFVHEPLPGLYRALPLARYDAAQARFWQRIFRAVRVPGGRMLLGWLAGRSQRRS